MNVSRGFTPATLDCTAQGAFTFPIRSAMARYKVLKSVAHNFAASFASVMNYAGNEYAMCHLVRRAHLTGSKRFRLDVLARMAGPLELLSAPMVRSCEAYCKDFGRLVTASGSALDMIDSAQVQVNVALGRVVGGKSKELYGRVTATMRIKDDRGREYVGALNPGLFMCSTPIGRRTETRWRSRVSMERRSKHRTSH